MFMAKPGAKQPTSLNFFRTFSVTWKTAKFFFMRNILIACFVLVIVNANAQRVVDVDKETGNAMAYNNIYTVAGTPFVNTKFARVVEGSPFFNEQLMKGAIILSGGKEYRNILLRLNLLETQVNYIDDKQVEIVASTPIREVVHWDTINKKDHRFVFSEYIETEDKIEKDFYELLQAGKAELYKQHKKNLTESKPYGSATVEQKIHTDIKYFVLKEKQWKRVKKLKDIITLLGDKTKEIEKYILENHVSGDNQQNFEIIIAHYNSLFNQK